MKEALETVSVKGTTVFIYLTPTKKNGKTYPGHTLVYTAAGDRKRKFVTDLEKARKEAKKIAEQLSEGTGHVHSLSPSEVSDYSAAIRLLRAHPGSTLAAVVAEWAQAKAAIGDGPLVTACTEYRKGIERQSGFTPALLPDIAVEFLRHLESADASRRYSENCRSQMNRAADVFRSHIHTITTQDLGAWLDGMKVAPRTRKNMRRALVTLFKFAKQQGYLPRDRQTEAELIPSRSKMNSANRQAPIGLYAPGDLTKILNGAPEELLPVFAIAAFAGIRSAELHRLTWGDIKKDHIIVEADKAKTASRRLLPIVPALKAWLGKTTAGDKEERLCRIYSRESGLARGMSAAIRGAGVEPVHNGFRHSFCTYRIASTQNVAQVALEAGNSPTMLFKHYRELATKKQAAAWFAVRPAGKGGKVLQFSAAA